MQMTSISVHCLKQMVSIDNYKEDNIFPLINKWIITQAYFFTVFPASIESGISETLSLGEKSLFSEKSFHFDGGNLEFPLSLEENPGFG